MPFPLLLPLLASGLASGVGGLLQGRADDKAADRIAGVRVPTAKELEIALQRYQSQGDPMLDQATPLGPSAMEGVESDPALRDYQLEALADLARIGRSGGLGPEEQLALEQSRQSTATAARGRQEALGALARRRGTAGGGIDAVQRAVAAQGATSDAANAGFEIAAAANRNRQDALSRLSSGAGALRSADFSEGSDRARAADAIAEFNARNLADTRRFNVNTGNLALGERQRIAEANVDTGNEQERYNKGIPLQRYRLQAGQAGDLAQLDQQKGARQASLFGGIGQLLGTFAGSR